MNTFDVYMIITLVYQYIIPLVYLIFAYTRMAVKLWRNKIPGKHLCFVLSIGSKKFGLFGLFFGWVQNVLVGSELFRSGPNHFQRPHIVQESGGQYLSPPARSVKFLYTSPYTWSDLMICFDSELFPQNFV